MHLLSADIGGENGVQNASPHCLLVSYLINRTIPFCSLLCGGNDICIMNKDKLNDFHTFVNANVCLPWILLNPSCTTLTLVLTFSHLDSSDRKCKHYGLS